MAILVYVMLDGFDLGVGILFGTTRDEAQREQMMGSIAPFWDGNETWLVVIGASLFAAFPAVYAVFLGAFYIPVLLLLFGLIFRGVAFEFRLHSQRLRKLWDFGFFAGSTVAAFVQGAAVGAMMRGIPVADRQFAGGSFDWFAPFPLLTGLGLVLGYALLGAGWLVLKTEGPLRELALRRIPWLAGGMLSVLAVAFGLTLDHSALAHSNLRSRPWGLVFPLIGSAGAGGRAAGHAAQARCAALCADRAVLPVGLHDAGRDVLAVHGALCHHRGRSGRGRGLAELPVLGCGAVRAAGDRHLHHRGVLDLPRQDTRGPRMSARRDLLAGLSLASMSIPQVLGYTRIAGMPVVTGLYTALLPVVAFALFGASRQMVVAADSATAAIFAGALRNMAEPMSPHYVQLAGMVALLSAAMLLLARLFQLGFLADFLSRTVLVGFLSGVGLQVCIAMLGDMLGLATATHAPLQQLAALARQLAQVDTAQAALSLAVLAVHRGRPRVSRRVRRWAWSLVIGAIAASAAFGFEQRGMAVIGAAARRAAAARDSRRWAGARCWRCCRWPRPAW